MSAMEAKRFRRCGAVPLSVGEGADNQLAAITIDGIVVGRLVRHHGGLSAYDSGGQMMHGQFRPVGQDDGALDNVGKLSDIARPVVRDQFVGRASSVMVEKLFLLSAANRSRK